MIAFGSAKNFYCCRSSTIVPSCSPLEVLRISTVVDSNFAAVSHLPFGSAKNFYCCRYYIPPIKITPLEVLRISTVVDGLGNQFDSRPLEVLRISTVVDRSNGF